MLWPEPHRHLVCAAQSRLGWRQSAEEPGQSTGLCGPWPGHGPKVRDAEMELMWQMSSSDSSSRPFVGPGAHCNTMNAPLPPFYLRSRLLLQHPFRRSLLAARRQGVHSGWCMPSLKDMQGSHTDRPKEQTSWRPLPSHPLLMLRLGMTAQSTTGRSPGTPGWQDASFC